MIARSALTGLLTGAALSFAVAAEATTVTWDFADLANTSQSVSGSGYGNTRTFTSDGLSVRVTAWSRQMTGGLKFQSAELGRWSGYGMGVCSNGGSEGKNCGSPQHQVDNQSRFDFVLFEFVDGAIDPTGVTIETFSDAGLDVSYFIGTGGVPIDLSNLTEADLAGLGFAARTDDSYSGSADWRSVGIAGSTGATSLLFGASETQTASPDYFKIVTLTAEVSSPGPNPAPAPVSEPGTLGLFGAALAGLALVRRRRKV